MTVLRHPERSEGSQAGDASPSPRLSMTTAFRIQREGDLAIIWFDLPGEKVNKFSSTVMLEFSGIVDELEKASDIKRVIFASGKPSIFIAGADVTEFSQAISEELAKEFTRFG